MGEAGRTGYNLMTAGQRIGEGTSQMGQSVPASVILAQHAGFQAGPRLYRYALSC